MKKIKATIKERWGKVKRHAYIPITLIVAPFIYLAIVLCFMSMLPFALLADKLIDAKEAMWERIFGE